MKETERAKDSWKKWMSRAAREEEGGKETGQMEGKRRKEVTREGGKGPSLEEEEEKTKCRENDTLEKRRQKKKIFEHKNQNGVKIQKTNRLRLWVIKAT